MKPLLNLLKLGSTTAEAAYKKLLLEIDPGTPLPSHYVERRGNKIAAQLAAANAALLAKPSDETFDKYFCAYAESETFKKSGFGHSFGMEESNMRALRKRSAPALRIVRAALLERAENIQAVIDRSRSVIAEKLGEIGLSGDPDNHDSLASLRSQLQDTVNAINSLDSERTPSDQTVHSWYVVLDTPINVIPIAVKPTPAEDHGFFTYGMAQQRKQPGFIPPVSHEENVAASHAAYQQNDFETLPGGGVVKRRVITRPPPMLEPQVQPDGSLVLGLHKPEHQPVNA